MNNTTNELDTRYILKMTFICVKEFSLETNEQDTNRQVIDKVQIGHSNGSVILFMNVNKSVYFV